MTNRLEGKVAVITGGTSGIGEASAELFAREGCKVVIAGRSVAKGEAIAERLGANVVYTPADVMKEDDIKATIDLAVKTFGKLDILFNNAGGATHGTFETVTQQDFADGMQLLFASVMFGK